MNVFVPRAALDNGVHAPPAKDVRSRLSGLQVLRGLAASAVVLSHAARHVDKAYGAPGLIAVFAPGHAGVDLFFVLSGFIILFVHRRDIGQPPRIGHYLSRRFTRVFPPYWVATALTIAMAVLGGHASIDLPGFLASVVLLPTVREPILGIGWTLQFEIVFYAVFALLILSRRLGLAILGFWLVWIAIVTAGPLTSPVPQFGNVYGIEFFFGMAAALVVRRGQVRAPLAMAATAALVFLLAMAGESAGLFDGTGTTARFYYGLPAAFLLVGVAAAEQAGRLPVAAWLRILGEASYSIYLFQFVFIGVVWQIGLKAGLFTEANTLLCFVLLAIAGILGGIATSLLVEQPLLRLARGARSIPPLMPLPDAGTGRSAPD